MFQRLCVFLYSRFQGYRSIFCFFFLSYCYSGRVFLLCTYSLFEMVLRSDYLALPISILLFSNLSPIHFRGKSASSLPTLRATLPTPRRDSCLLCVLWSCPRGRLPRFQRPIPTFCVPREGLGGGPPRPRIFPSKPSLRGPPCLPMLPSIFRLSCVRNMDAVFVVNWFRCLVPFFFRTA